MKKLMCILLSLSMVFAFAACGGSDEAKDGADAAKADVVKGEMEFALEEAANFDGLKITAVEMVETKGDEIFSAEEGNVFVGVKFLVENETEETVAISSLLMFEAYADDFACDYSISGVTALGETTIDGDVAPGKKLEGWYAVEVSEDWAELEIRVNPDMFSEDTAIFVINK